MKKKARNISLLIRQNVSAIDHTIILFTIFLISDMTGNCQITFEKTYGGSEMDFGYSVRQTTDNGYILLGSTESFSASRDIYLIKTNQYGDTLWTKTFGGPSFDNGSEVQQTMEGGYILCGDKYGQTFIVKTETNGDTIWTKTYSGYGNSIVQTADSGYTIAGYSSNHVLLFKINSSGDTLWTKYYGSSPSQNCRDSKQTNDGGYILVGNISTGSACDVYLIKTDAIGDTLWTKSYGGSGYDEGYSVVQTNDNGYVLLGNSNSFGGEMFYLIKTDINGNLQWTKTYDGNLNDEGYEVQQTSDGGFVFVAETDKNGLGYDEVFLVKTDAIGDTLWTRTYNQGNGNGLQVTSDGGYIILGFTGIIGAGMNDFYLIKTDNNGNVSGMPNTNINNNFKITSYPNPFNDFTTVKFENSDNCNYTLTLYNTQGEIIRDISNITSDKVVIERKNLNSGLYFYQLRTDKRVVAVGKLIIE